jgi:hypothetical protein
VGLPERLMQLVAAMPDEAAVVLPIAWLRAELATSEPPPALDPIVSRDPLMTVREVAHRFARSPSAVRSWAEQGLLKGAYRLRGRAWRIPLSSVVAFEDAQRQSRTGAEVVRLGPSERLGDWRRRAL